MFGGGAVPGIIRGRQGTEAMSYLLSLAAGRWPQARCLLRSSLCPPPPLWSPCPPPGAQLLWHCLWPCMKVSRPGLACCSGPGSVRGCAPWGRGAPPKPAVGIQEWDPGSSGGFRGSASTKVVQVQGSHQPSPPERLGLPRAGRELLSSENANYLNYARGGARQVPLSRLCQVP